MPILIAVLFMLFTENAPACEKDIDCDGMELCIDGACRPPGPSRPETEPTPEPVPTDQPPVQSEPAPEDDMPAPSEPEPRDQPPPPPEPPPPEPPPPEPPRPPEPTPPPEAPIPPEPPPPKPPPEPEPQPPAKPAAEKTPPFAPTEKEEIFSWFTVSPQVGYLFFPRSEMTFNGFKATVDPRNGLAVKLHLDLGGDGLAFEISPLYAMELGGIRPDAEGFANLSGMDFGEKAGGASFQAVGLELAIVYRFPVKRVFPHIGAGFHGAYLFGDQIEYGTEIYGRFPIGLTVYLAKHLALVFEVGLMAGATGLRTPPKLPESFDSMPEDLREELQDADSRAEVEAWYENNTAEIDQWMLDNRDELPDNYSRSQMVSDIVDEQMSKTIRFGSGFGMDIVIGLRFP